MNTTYSFMKHLTGDDSWRYDCSAMAEFPTRDDKDGNPVIADCQTYNFGLFYATKEVRTLFRSIYYNVDGMGDKFVAYWKRVA